MTRSTKKLAFCISSFRAGGGEKQLIDIANAFARQGHVVHLLVLKPVGHYAPHVDANVVIVSLDGGRMLFSLPKLVRYLRGEQPTALLALDEYTHVLSVVARIIAHVDTRIVLRVGNMLSELSKRYEGKNRVLPVLIRHLYKRADYVVANSQGVADDVLVVTGIPASRLSVIYNPKDIEQIAIQARSTVTHPWLHNQDVPVVIVVGRLRLQKNIPLIIRAFARVRKDVPARLLILGEGRERKRLETLVATLDHKDDIEFVGYVDNPYAWMAHASVYVAASLWEGMPNALIEALACGLPSIASDCSSGPREVLAPDSDYAKRLSVGDAPEYARFGVLCAVNDENAVTLALGNLLQNAQLRLAYAEASVERAYAFDATGRIQEYARVLGVESGDEVARL